MLTKDAKKCINLEEVKKTNKISRHKSKISTIDNGLADFLRDWNPDNPEGQLFSGDGEEIVGEKKREIMNTIKYLMLNGPYFHTCKIRSLKRYREKNKKGD